MFDVTPETFHYHSTNRPLFLDTIQVGRRFLVFKTRQRGDSLRANVVLQYLVGPKSLISYLPDPGVVTFDDACVLDIQFYGKEWFLARAI